MQLRIVGLKGRRLTAIPMHPPKSIDNGTSTHGDKTAANCVGLLRQDQLVFGVIYGP
jgi:hypothetical protein